MAKKEETIAVDQTDVHAGDTVTFSVTGEHKDDDISIQVFPDEGNPDGTGPKHSARQDVGTAFVIPTDKWDGPATCIANLERNNKIEVSTGFRIT